MVTSRKTFRRRCRDAVETAVPTPEGDVQQRSAHATASGASAEYRLSITCNPYLQSTFWSGFSFVPNLLRYFRRKINAIARSASAIAAKNTIGSRESRRLCIEKGTEVLIRVSRIFFLLNVHLFKLIVEPRLHG